MAVADAMVGGQRGGDERPRDDRAVQGEVRQAREALAALDSKKSD